MVVRYAVAALLAILLSFGQSVHAQAPNLLWSQSYGSGAPLSLVEISDGGFIAAGYLNLQDVTYSRLLRVDAQGDVVWDRILSPGQFCSVIKTSDNGFLAVGRENASMLAYKFNLNGDSLWTQSYPGSIARSVVETGNGDYVIAGSGGDVVLHRISSSGNLLWTRSFNGGGIYPDGGHSVSRTSDGGFIVGGDTKAGCACPFKAWLLRVNSDGDTLWTRQYGSSSHADAASVLQTADGGFIFTGKSGVSLRTVRTNSFGDLIWTSGFHYAEYGSSIALDSGGGYLVVGSYLAEYGEDLLLMHIGDLGDTLWTATFGESLSVDYGFCGIQTSDGGYIVGGAGNCTSPFCLDSEFQLFRLESNNITGVGTPVHSPADLSVEANPFRSSVQVTYTLDSPGHIALDCFGVKGNLIARLDSGFRERGDHFISSRSALREAPDGFYFVRLTTAGTMASIKVLKVP